MPKPIVIVHFQPLERYPPVINLLRYLAKENQGGFEIYAISTAGPNPQKQISIPGIEIHRVAAMQSYMSFGKRLWLYLDFIRKTYALLRRIRPGKLMYFETLSAGAPCVYKWLNSDTELFVHYHEYTSNSEYQSGMVLNKWLHTLERRMYSRTTWLSHTIGDRMNLFLQEHQHCLPPHQYLLPNYPPACWKMKQFGSQLGNDKVGFIYIGALGLDTMYIREIVSLVSSQPEKYWLDFYSDNYGDEVVEYFKNLTATNIHFKGALEYDAIPGILRNYRVGLILYKGHIPNYVYNAPNKLFEYLVCGLDVWAPSELKSAAAYETQGTYPVITRMDFDHLTPAIAEEKLRRENLRWVPQEYFCEEVLLPLKEKLFL